MAVIIDGKALSAKLRSQLKADIENNLTSKGLKAPKLMVVLVGNDPASQIYVKNKVKACSDVGIISDTIILPETTSQQTLDEVITKLNKDKTVNGILLQLPLPKHLDSKKTLNLISPEKDVDGLTNVNLGKLVNGDSTAIKSCTPSGVMEMLKEYNIPISGKKVAIINRTNLVGKPLSLLMTGADGTVTLCHSKTQNLKDITLTSDIVVTAVGKKNFITADMIKKGSTVIDVAIVRDENGKVCGDVDFENVSKKASHITPVPGGCGPMTITMLLKNTYETTLTQNKNKVKTTCTDTSRFYK